MAHAAISYRALFAFAATAFFLYHFVRICFSRRRFSLKQRGFKLPEFARPSYPPRTGRVVIPFYCLALGVFMPVLLVTMAESFSRYGNGPLIWQCVTMISMVAILCSAFVAVKTFATRDSYRPRETDAIAKPQPVDDFDFAGRFDDR